MRIRFCFRLFLGTLALIFVANASLRAATPLLPAGTASPSGLWREADDKPLLAARGLTADAARRGAVPMRYRTLTLDRAALSALLATAPREFSAAARGGGPATEIELPVPASGDFARFTVEESPIMEEGLAARYPEIRTYTARGIDDPAMSARLDVTSHGFHAMILGPRGQIFIDPYFADGSDLATTIAYFKRDYLSTSKPFQCLVHGDERPSKEAQDRAGQPAPERPTGASLRVYRLAVGTTGEYSVAVAGASPTVAGVLGAVVTTVNRVDAVYERDFAIRMVLVANEDKMIYLDGSTDPYDNGTPNSLLTQNQTTCDSIIGTANYDIGHVFSTAGGGLAGLGVVCGTRKAQGETGTSNPTGDPYDIDYVAHEMGHQFGANHTFNSTTQSCGGGNRSATHAYEPGSGTTIMAYAGICSTATNVQDLAPHSDDYFHTTSYDEIDTYTTTGTGQNAFQTIATGNNPPVVAAPTAYTIPISTPFALTASATDADGDRLTYCWEEYDRGAAVNATATSGLDNGASPIFRSYAPTTNPTRTFPSLTYILNNANVPPLRGTVDGNYLIGEALPSVARAAGLSFRCTVRDNRAGGGGSNYALVTLAVATGAGPFAVTSPNTAVSIAGGSTQTVTWNVANTTASPVSCANVKISLSTDGGYTFPYVLASSVPNSGSASVVIPSTANVATQQGRIKVEAVGNIFFDISDANFTITSTNTPPTFAASGTGITIVRGTPSAVTATVGTATAGSSALASASVSGAPDGVVLVASIAGNSVQLTGSADCRVTTTLGSRTYPVIVTVTDAAGSTASGTVNVFIQPNPSPTLGDYPTAVSVPRNGSATILPATGPADANGNLAASPFSLVPTTLPGGGTLSVNQATGAVTITPSPSSTLTTTLVRVTCQDTCGAAVTKLVNVTVGADAFIAPNFTNGAPPSPAAAGSSYSFTFAASGTPAPTFAVTGGTLPPGLTLNATTGVLSGVPTTPGVYSNIQVTASNGTAPNATQTFSLTVTGTYTSYATANGLTGPSAAPTADADFDGLPNLLEYALNLPSNANNLAPQVVVRNYAGVNYLSIRFTRVPLATDVTYIVEASGDLTSAWTAVATGAAGNSLTGPGVVSDPGGTSPVTVEVRDTVALDPAATGLHRFLRLRVTSP